MQGIIQDRPAKGNNMETNNKKNYSEEYSLVTETKPENPSPIQKDLILLKDVKYFGRIIKRGSTFKRLQNDIDWYVLWENDNGILMHCPAIKLHFTSSISNEYFVMQYE